MKKTYIIPLTIVEFTQAETMIAASITNVGGNSGIEVGTGETPEEAGDPTLTRAAAAISGCAIMYCFTASIMQVLFNRPRLERNSPT